MMVVLIFVGVFVARTVNRMAGIVIVVGAAIFLLFTMSKSPIGLLPLAAGLSIHGPSASPCRRKICAVIGAVLSSTC